MASDAVVTTATRVLGAVTAPVGGGTIGNFTELNRNRPAPGAMPLLAYPFNPQVHATDDLSVVENLGAIWSGVATARAFAREAKLAVGPVSLARQPDPFAAGKSGPGAGAAAGDPRQRSAFGAAWTVGALKHLCEAGVASATLYQTHGAMGLTDESGAFPLYHVLAAAGELAGGEVLLCTQGRPLRQAGLAFGLGNRVRWVVANLHYEEATLELRGLDGFTVKAARELPREPGGEVRPADVAGRATLPAYGVVVLDLERVRDE